MYTEYIRVSMRYLLVCAGHSKSLLGISTFVRRIHPCVYVLAQIIQHWKTNDYKECLRTYAEYIHVSMRYLVICANNSALDKTSISLLGTCSYAQII